ncbi:YihY/virulence factor BrkB family protein [Acrocarpospora macrocephala]|uniref:Ribonuclease n=1 Tax=Acrocarpospora macrocephala TaxID=150177 RepID=A0A5M3WRK3_9ACTN|nr:YihY/virulence factor BrkB family protein [Acrocarpospora macrocephala]GES12007.1 ribonuclease [Acrocarpospora macrocephala]
MSEQPDKPPERPPRSWWGVLKRTGKEFKRDHLADWAAALTYYAVLSIFPALLAVISILGLFGQPAAKPLMDLGEVVPGARQILNPVLQALRSNQTAAGFAAIFSIAVALWSASGYVGAFMRVANVVYGIEEARPIWKTLALRVAATAILVIAVTVSAVGVVLTGNLARRAGQLLGIGQTGVTIWNIAKWPVLVLIVMMVLALLYWAGPNVEHPGFRWLTPGSALAVIIWIIASAAFAFYVVHFASYSKTYATLAGMIVFLIWLWLSNIAVLLGVELDAELTRERAG